MLYAAGLRTEEALALRWSDVQESLDALGSPGRGGVIAYPSIVPCRTRHTMSVNLFEDWRSWLRDWRFWFFVAMSILVVAGYLTVFIILLSPWHK